MNYFTLSFLVQCSPNHFFLHCINYVSAQPYRNCLCAFSNAFKKKKINSISIFKDIHTFTKSKLALGVHFYSNICFPFSYLSFCFDQFVVIFLHATKAILIFNPLRQNRTLLIFLCPSMSIFTFVQCVFFLHSTRTYVTFESIPR